MKILKYCNRKGDDVLWDASTPELEAAAFWRLFEVLKYWTSNYADLRSVEQDVQDLQRRLTKLNSPSIDDLHPLFKVYVEKQKELAEEIREGQEQMRQAEWCRKAENGDYVALRQLLKARDSYEYEEWEVVEIEDPMYDAANKFYKLVSSSVEQWMAHIELVKAKRETLRAINLARAGKE